MNSLRAFFERLKGFLHRGESNRRDNDFADELDTHIALHVEENLRRGMSPAEARRQALVALGGLEPAKEAHRDRRGLPWLDTFAQDVRFGLRMMRKNPGFAAIAILTIALGIGANTAIFSVVNAVLLAPLPFDHPERVVMLWGTNLRKNMDIMPVSPATFATWKSSSHSFEGMGGSSDSLASFTEGEPEMVAAYDFSADYFRVLGAKAELGRTFLPEEDQPGGPNVCVLSDKIWRRRFGGDPAIVGRAIRMGATLFTVVGVMPPNFRWPSLVEVWTPLALPASASSDWRSHYIRVVARLKPGVTIEQTQAELNAIAARAEKEHPETNADEGVVVEPIRHNMFGDVQRPLLVLLGAVGFVLLIACVNVAGLLLARTSARGREIAVRAALGAGRARLIRQMVTESVLLSLLGGVSGLALAYGSTGLLVKLFPNNIANLNIPLVEAIPVDGRVLAFTLGATLLTGLLFGLAPALVWSRADVNTTLKGSGRSPASGARERRLRNVLAVAEISLAFVLLIGAGLLVRGFLLLTESSLGFRPEKVLALELFAPRRLYPVDKPAKLRSFIEQSVENLQAVPGVESAAATNFLPLTGFWGTQRYVIEGRPAPEKGREPEADDRLATPDYFRTMGIPLVRGRVFTMLDGPDSPHVAVISSSFAERYWKNEDPIGRRINLGTADHPDWHEIVGVVGTVHAFGLEEKPHDDLYRPFAQVWFPLVAFTVKASGDPTQIAAAAKATIWKIDPTQPFYKVITMDELAGESLALRRVSTLLLAGFSAIALALAAVGIYGVLSYSVAQRTQEIGIRAALGASRGDVLRMVLGDGARIAAAGTGLGIAAALALSQLLGSLLYSVGARDPATFGGVGLLCIAVALAACYIPARRATRVDPLVALRHE